ncbi:hypothetical protein BaRGS_00026078 [Batillaria attramentaria]|uniref:Uncharacterized protein n=1 Tax=Batillaria attramentaria TaxID=370345 RepID=A0ABD0K698_9CAEN
MTEKAAVSSPTSTICRTSLSLLDRRICLQLEIHNHQAQTLHVSGRDFENPGGVYFLVLYSARDGVVFRVGIRVFANLHGLTASLSWLRGIKSSVAFWRAALLLDGV